MLQYSENLRTGTILGHYVITFRVGQGGMGTVYKAYEPALDRHVAIKVLASELVSDPEHVKFFQDEARAVAALRHNNIIPIHYIGEEANIVFFSMAFIEGETFDDWLDREKRFTEQEAFWFLNQAIAALDTAYKGHIIHLDIKPGNFLIDKGKTIILSDFGLAERLISRQGGNRPTRGTPYYVSPEQICKMPTDQRTDIYSLGATLFHLWVGEPLYPGRTVEEASMAHLTGVFPEETARLAGLPEGWVQIIKKMVARNQKDRFSDYDELQAAVTKLAKERRALGTEKLPAKEDLRRQQSQQPALGANPQVTSNRAPKPILATIFVICLLIAITILFRSGKNVSSNGSHPLTAQGSGNSTLPPPEPPSNAAPPQEIKAHAGASGDQISATVLPPIPDAVVTYFSYLGNRWSLPEGILPVTDSAALSHRHLTWKFESVDGKVRRVTLINGLGYHADFLEPNLRYSFAVQDIHYDDSGNLKEIVFLSHTLKVMYRETFYALQPSGDNHKSQHVSVKFADIWRYDPWYTGHDNSLATGFQIEYDSHGKVFMKSSVNDYLAPRFCEDGSLVRRYTYNTLGMVVKDENLDLLGHPLEDASGVATTEKSFDENSHGYEVRYYDGDSKLVEPSSNRYAHLVTTVDSYDNPIQQTLYRSDDQPIVGLAGYVVAKVVYDDHGEPTKIVSLPPSGEITKETRETTYDWDERGNQIEIRQTDLTGTLIYKYLKKYDSRGNLIEIRGHSPGANPPPGLLAAKDFQYDENSNLIESANVGFDNEPAITNDGYARTTYIYDPKGNLIERDRLDGKGQLYAHTGNPAKEIWKYDDRGNVIEHTEMDSGGNTFRTVSGVYDDHDNLIESRVGTTPTQIIVKLKYDNTGNRVEEAFFGPNGEPSMNSLKAYKRILGYDSVGRIIREDFCDSTGAIKNNVLGVASILHQYNQQGDMEESFLDEDGQPISDRLGVTSVTMRGVGNQKDYQLLNFQFANNSVQFPDQRLVFLLRFRSPALESHL